MNAIFAIAILVALGAVVAKKVAPRFRRARIDAANEATNDRVVDVPGFEALQAHVARARCACGGGLSLYGEGPEGAAWVARARCRACGADVRISFRVADA